MASTDVVEKIARYLEGGDFDDFGGRDPFRKVSGGGGLRGMANLLSVKVEDVEDCPEGDNQYSAMLLGHIVAGAKLEASDRTIMDMFMEIAYADEVTGYKTGLSMKKAVVKEASSVSSSGGRVPTKGEATSIEKEKGMPWQCGLAISSILVTGVVPTVGELEREG